MLKAFFTEKVLSKIHFLEKSVIKTLFRKKCYQKQTFFYRKNTLFTVKTHMAFLLKNCYQKQTLF